MNAARARAHKGYKSGTHRLVPPAETLARLRPLLPRIGITRIANVTGLDTIGIPVVMAIRPNSRSLSVSQGKGLDLDAAKVSALMESLEGFHAEQIMLPLKLASYRELSTAHNVVDVDRLPREIDNAFHRNLPILWVEGEEWVQHERIWVPYQMVHTRYTREMAFDLTSFAVTSNGLASGNHLLEAASHGICEVVERDADDRFLALAWEEREARRIDLDTVDHPDCRDLLDRCERAGIAVAMWNITCETAMPAFHCQIAERRVDAHRRMYAAEGAGCHPVRHIAFLRALTEAVQGRLTAISGARDDMPRSDYELWRAPANLATQSEIAGRRGSQRFSDVPSYESDSFEADIAWELERVRAAGFDRVIVIDLSLPEIDVAVVRVIIPGARISEKPRIAIGSRRPRKQEEAGA